MESHFLKDTENPKKAMVLDLGFLGDTVHLLSALWMVRMQILIAATAKQTPVCAFIDSPRETITFLANESYNYRPA